ncbi:MAG: tetratricopeptide repeat protein, partial [Woeseiaceae bacterium]
MARATDSEPVPYNRSLRLLVVSVLALAGCSEQLSEPTPLTRPWTLQIGPGESTTFPVEVPAGTTVRVSAVQRGVDIELQLQTNEPTRHTTVDLPYQRSATEYLTKTVSRAQTAVISVSAVEHDASHGTVHLVVESLQRKSSADRKLVAAELQWTEVSRSDPNREDRAEQALAYEELGDEFRQLNIVRRRADALMQAASTHYWWNFKWRKSANLAGEAQREYAGAGDLLESALASDLQGAALIELISEPEPGDSREGTQAEIEQVLDRALQSFESLGETFHRARVINNLGLMHYYLGQYDQSQARYEQARELFSVVPDKRWEIITLQNLLLQDFELRRDVAKAPARFEQLLALIDKNNDTDLYVDVLNNAALANATLGNMTRAVGQFEQALELWKEHPSRGRIYSWLALVYLRGGDYASAKTLLKTAFLLQEESDDQRDIADTRRLLGVIYRHDGEINEAIEAHSQSLAAQQSDYRKAQARLELVRDYLAANDLAAAQQQLSAVEELVEAANAPGIASVRLVLQGKIATAAGNHDLARAPVLESIDIAKEFALWTNLHEAYLALADHYEALNNSAEMRDALFQAASVVEDARARFGSSEMRAALLADRGDAYDRLIASYLRDYAEIPIEIATER